MKKKVLITGAAGFLGYFLVKEFINDYDIICLVRPESTNLVRLQEFRSNIKILEHDIKNSYIELLPFLKDTKIILHAAGNPSAESSVIDPISVVHDNILGTLGILEISKSLDLERFVYYSAGEVFGSVPHNYASKENDAYDSLTPYSASKAGGEELCVAYSKCFNIPVSILHVSNTFGEMSQSNRFPVIAIKKILNRQNLEIHTNSDQSISGRRWQHASNVAEHTRFILNHQQLNCEKWNSSGLEFISNLDFAKFIADVLKQPLLYELVPSSRFGHEHVAMDSNKIYNAGYLERLSMLDKLTATVDWYKNNQQWLI